MIDDCECASNCNKGRETPSLIDMRNDLPFKLEF